MKLRVCGPDRRPAPVSEGGDNRGMEDRVHVIVDVMAAHDVTVPARPDTLAIAPTAKPAEPDVAVDRTRYAVISELARGGGGRISIAIDRKLGRRVALKRALDDDGGARIEREAHVLARLAHPAIVPMYDAGVDASGAPFYTMKLLGGRDLAAAIDAAHTFDARLALLAAVTTVADATAHAHAQRVIHRDLKPGNILVGEFAEVAVIDWGLGKLLGSADDEPAAAAAFDEAALTLHGAVMGTPAYMAPEQALAQPTDERGDVYAIGAILYHVLSGEVPYGRLDSEQTLAQLVEGPPPPVEHREPRVPKDLAAIVAKALAREPRDRYPTARELAEDLHRYQNGRLVAAHRYAVWARAWRWLRRHRAVVAVAAAAAATAIAIALFVVSGHTAARLTAAEQQARDRAEQAARAGVALQAKERERTAALAQQATAEAARQRAQQQAAASGSLVEETREELKAKNARLEAALDQATAARERADEASRAAAQATAAAERANAELQTALDRERAHSRELDDKRKQLSTTLK